MDTVDVTKIEISVGGYFAGNKDDSIGELFAKIIATNQYEITKFERYSMCRNCKHEDKISEEKEPKP